MERVPHLLVFLILNGTASLLEVENTISLES